jgi:hypothetical protein
VTGNHHGGKAYDPSVADAFKVKSVPQLNITTRSRRRSYSIFSVPGFHFYTNKEN